MLATMMIFFIIFIVLLIKSLIYNEYQMFLLNFLALISSYCMGKTISRELYKSKNKL
jgi:membrane protein required for beta-lactamase induction